MPEHFKEGAVIGQYTDRWGDVQTLHKGKNSIQVKRPRLTPILAATNFVGQHIGQRVREERERLGLTLEALGTRAGLRGTPKERMWEIERGVRSGGIRFGTLYLVALALGVTPADLMPSADEVATFLSAGDEHDDH